MSILNVWVSEKKLAVLVDSRTRVGVSDVYGQASKMVPLVHANVIIAGRGSPSFVYTVFGFVAQQLNVCGLDSVEALLRADLARFFSEAWFPAAAQSMPGASADALSQLAAQQVLIAGFSERHDQMRAVNFTQLDSASGFEVVEVMDTAFASPWASDWDDAPCVDSAADLASLAALQLTRVGRTHPGESIGGPLILAELDKFASLRIARMG